MHVKRWAYIVGVIVIAGIVAGILWLGPDAPERLEPPFPADSTQIDPIVLLAIERTAQHVRDAPKDPVAWYTLGGVYHAHRLMELASTCYLQAAALDPDEPKTHYQLARVKDALGEYDDALEQIDAAIALNDTFAPAHWRRGEWLAQSGRIDEAEQSLRRAVELAPESAATVQSLASVLLQREKFEEARSLLEAYNARHPDQPYMNQLLGTTYVGLGRVEQGRRLLANAYGKPAPSDDPWGAEIARMSTGYLVIIQHAKFLATNGQPENALKELDALLEYYPEDIRLLNQIASTYTTMRRPEQAITFLEKSIAIKPEQFAAQLNLAYRYEQIGRRDLAMKHVDIAIANDPRKTDALVQKGRLLILDQDFPAAAAILEQAIAMGADHPMNLVTIGQVRDRMGDAEEALDWFQKAIDRSPDLVSAHIGVAMALAGLHDAAGAREALANARRMAPNDPFLETAAKIIDDRLEAGGDSK
jgi:tetratricopeptide (TPR) repeat protein